MSSAKTGGDQKPTISPTNHADNVGQRGGKQHREHAEEPNTGMRVAEGGNKVQGDDLEDMIPGKQANRRGAETFDAEGEKLEKTAHRGHDEDPEGDAPVEDSDDERGAETFDISENVSADQLVDRDEGNRRGDGAGEKPSGRADKSSAKKR